jgi:hypothetical protein
MSCSIISTNTRKLLFHNKIQQSRFNLIKIALGAGGAIGVQMKSLLFVLVKSHNLVFSGVPILARLKADKKK